MTDPDIGLGKELEEKIAQAKADGQQVLVIDPNDLSGVNHAKLTQVIERIGELKEKQNQMFLRGQTFDQVWLNELSIDKVDPSEFFISTGPGPSEGRYYGCVMRPASDEEILEQNTEEFIVVAIETGPGHRETMQALESAAMRYPTLPVLMGDKYFYPCFKSYDRKRKILAQAEERRQRRGLTKRPNIHGGKGGDGSRYIGPKHKRRKR